jgi:hypothetical protein
MNRVKLLGCIVVATLAVSGALSAPQPAHAQLCCETGYQTAQYRAMGPTCADAQAAYRALARPEADAACGGSTMVCAFSIPPCEDNSGYDPANPWVIDGVANYGCKYDCEFAPSTCCTRHRRLCEDYCAAMGKRVVLYSCMDTGPTSCEGYCGCG